MGQLALSLILASEQSNSHGKFCFEASWRLGEAVLTLDPERPSRTCLKPASTSGGKEWTVAAADGGKCCCTGGGG